MTTQLPIQGVRSQVRGAGISENDRIKSTCVGGKVFSFLETVLIERNSTEFASFAILYDVKRIQEQARKIGGRCRKDSA